MQEASVRETLVNMISSVDVFVGGMGYCPYCSRLIEALGKLQTEYKFSMKYISDADSNSMISSLRELAKKAFDGYSTIPLLFVKGRFLGGYSDYMKIKDRFQDCLNMSFLEKSLILTKNGKLN
ncbi:glutaredoxin 3 [Nematocida sp. LUAm3]|nr:glutaredoxin 3 [Nematocida sp. LUAm3]KAI5175831.1 glutaredoxin 3 [Nematocida sp. LUAm2]KAI5178327.1 glutaredoxin 3 [Nematocida sp. LUAm1]